MCLNVEGQRSCTDATGGSSVKLNHSLHYNPSPPLHCSGSPLYCALLHEVSIVHWTLTWISHKDHAGFISSIPNSWALRYFVTLICEQKKMQRRGWASGLGARFANRHVLFRPGDGLDREPRRSVPQQTHRRGEIPSQSPGPAEKARRLWRCRSGESAGKKP